MNNAPFRNRPFTVIQQYQTAATPEDHATSAQPPPHCQAADDKTPPDEAKVELVVDDQTEQ